MHCQCFSNDYEWTFLLKVAQSCLTLCNPMVYTVHGILQARSGVGSLSLLQGIFLTQGSNPGLLQSRQIETQGKPEFNYYHHLLLAMSSWAKCLAPLNVCKVSILASAPLLPGTVVTIADIIIMLYNRCMAMNFT